MDNDDADADRGSMPPCYRELGEYIHQLHTRVNKYRKRAQESLTTISSLEQTVEVQSSIISSLQDQVMNQRRDIERLEYDLATLRSSQSQAVVATEVTVKHEPEVETRPKRPRVLDNIPNLRHRSEVLPTTKRSTSIRAKLVNIPRTELDTQYSQSLQEDSPLKLLPLKCQRDIATQISSSPDKNASPLKLLPRKRPLLNRSSRSSPQKPPAMTKQASVELGGNDDDEVDDSQDEEPLVKLILVPLRQHATPLMAQSFRRQYLLNQLAIPGIKLDITTNPVTNKPWTVSDFTPNGDGNGGFGGGRKLFAAVKGLVVVRDQGFSRQDYDNRKMFYSMVASRALDEEDDDDDGENNYSQLQSQIHNKVPLQEWRLTIPSTQEGIENARRSYVIKRRRVVRRIKQSLKVTVDQFRNRVQCGDFKFAEEVINQYVVEGRVVVRYTEILQGVGSD